MGLRFGLVAGRIIANNHVRMLSGVEVSNDIIPVLLRLCLQSGFRTQSCHFTLILNCNFRLKAHLVRVLRYLLLKSRVVYRELPLFHTLVIYSNHTVGLHKLFRVRELIKCGYHHNLTLITLTIWYYYLISSFVAQLWVWEAARWLRVHPYLCRIPKYWILLIMLRLILCIWLLKGLIVPN